MKPIAYLLLASLCCFSLTHCSREKNIDQVILVTIDTLRADHLGMHGYLRNTSPFLDSLAAKGVNFMKAMASSSHTAPSHATIFTSLHPAQHCLLVNGQTLNDSFVTMAEIFKKNGYETAAFTSINFLKGVGQGFDHFDSPTLRPIGGGVRFRNATETVDHAIQWLKDSKRSKKAFVWIHLYDVHQALPEFTSAPLQEYLRRVTGDRNGPRWIRFLIHGRGYPQNIWDKEKVLALIDRYDAQILNVDTELHRLYDATQKNGRFKHSMWMITADHGEGLGNHHYLGHGERIYQEQLHVPLIFYFPDQRYGSQKVSTLVRHVDLLPTVLDLMKWPLQGQRFPVEGYSLASVLHGSKSGQVKDFAFAQRRPADEGWRYDWEKGDVYSLQTTRYKYIEHSEGEDEFFDLQKDPFELRNLTQDSKDKENLRKALRQMYGKFIAQSGGIKQPGIEQEYVDELKSLGYL